jgi:hypothetical protein
MTCDDVRARLGHPDHAAGGVLSPEILAHIEDCPNCRRFRERLAAILDPSSALPREIQPSRDLWPAIASRLEKADERKSRRISKFLPLAAAAGIAAAVIASLFSLPLHESSTVARAPIRTPETTPAPLPAATVEIGFVQTRVVLAKMVEARKNTMPPEQVAVLEKTLSRMDSAVQDIHAALELEPHNPSLLFKLSHVRRRELRLLQQAIL